MCAERNDFDTSLTFFLSETLRLTRKGVLETIFVINLYLQYLFLILQSPWRVQVITVDFKFGLNNFLAQYKKECVGPAYLYLWGENADNANVEYMFDTLTPHLKGRISFFFFTLPFFLSLRGWQIYRTENMDAAAAVILRAAIRQTLYNKLSWPPTHYDHPPSSTDYN
jgi:hypothetical protein